MHVVIPVSDNPWRPRAGGIVSYSLGLAAYLRNHGVDVEFLSVGGDNGSSPIRTTSVSDRTRGEIAYARALGAYARSRRWDVDTVVVANTELYAWALRRARPLPRFVLISHGPTVPTLAMRRPLVTAVFRAIVEPRAVRLLETVVAIDREAEAYFGGRYPKAVVRRIPLAVDTDHFHPVDRVESRVRWSLKDELAVLFVGRIAPEKNPLLAASTFELIAERTRHAVLLVAGAGPTSRPFLQIQERLGSMRVRFLGLVPRKDLPSLYSAADGVMLTSSKEQFPTVAVESLACGSPVFATDVGDVSIILDRREAGEVCPHAPKAFAEKVLERLPETSEERERCVVVRRETAERYSWNRIGPQLLEVIRGNPVGERRPL